jgi:predicted ABC-type ATPase
MQPSLRKVERPILWMIAGPNGSGKSTLYNRTDIEEWGGSVWIINPDLLTARLQTAENLKPDIANATALDRIQAWLQASIDVHQTIGVETVLSTPKYRPLIEQARDKGFEIRMLYVVLDSADLQLERITLRVSEGGHDVPSAKVVARRQRSFEQLALFAKHLDRLMIFNNSTGEPALAAYKRFKQPLQIVGNMPADLRRVLERAHVPGAES